MHSLDWPVTLPARTGATPVWHPMEKRLYWSDPASGNLYRFNPEDGTNELCFSDRPVGAITIQEDGSLLLFRDQANVVVFRDNQITDTIINSIADFKLTQFSSAVADSQGRVICSVLSDSKHTGRLLRLDRTGHLDLIDDGFGIPAAMAFDATGARFYFNDAHRTHLTTWVYDYDVIEGKLGDRRIFFTSIDDQIAVPGSPMGLAVDTDASLWITRWSGSCIVRHSPDGTLAATERLPVRKPAGVAFGGPDLSDIYITTSGGHRRTLEGLHSGDLARMRVDGVRGIQPFFSKIRIGEGFEKEPAEPASESEE